jgi:hypothetical protein
MASDSQPNAIDARATYPPITTTATTLASIQNQSEVLPCPSVLQSPSYPSSLFTPAIRRMVFGGHDVSPAR